MTQSSARKKPDKKGITKWQKQIIYAVWGSLVAFIGIAFCVFAAIVTGVIGYMPLVEELENPINKYASQIISSDGKLLGQISYAKDNRI